MGATKFTPETRQIILEALAQNPSLESAATAASITLQTLLRWLDAGQQGDERYAEFALDCARRRAHIKNELFQSLFEIATDRLHPQAVKSAQLLLQTQFPTEYSSVRHVVSHRKPEEQEYKLDNLSHDELRIFTRLLKRATAEGDQGLTALAPASSQVIDVLEDKAKSRTSN